MLYIEGHHSNQDKANTIIPINELTFLNCDSLSTFITNFAKVSRISFIKTKELSPGKNNSNRIVNGSFDRMIRSYKEQGIGTYAKRIHNRFERYFHLSV